MAITYTLLASQNGKRVRLETTATDPISVVVGSASETWPDGCYIEILNLGTPGPMTIAGDSGVTVNYYNGTVIPSGGYARVSQVTLATWDAHIYFSGVPAETGIEVQDAAGASISTAAEILQAGPGLTAILTAVNRVTFSVSHVSEDISFGV